MGLPWAEARASDMGVLVTGGRDCSDFYGMLIALNNDPPQLI